MIRRKLARWYLGVDSTLNNCYLYCIQIDWERNHNLIYCERICMMFEWKCWTNWVICSRYNAAWFVGDLKDDIWELIDLWTIVSWIVCWLIESAIMRGYIVRGFACWMNVNAVLIKWFLKYIMQIDYEETCKMMVWRLIVLWTIVSWIVSRFILSEIMRWCMYNGRICMLIEWECWTNWVIYNINTADWLGGN